ncbi:MAG: hypothetical protein LW852_02445 [Sediminibacterium sp.]|jgi:hypothetical protein|nr:hypothetical protein [Sediminibacterium sp.]
MKKIIWKILFGLIVIILFVLIRPIRTKSVMKSIAKDEFDDIQVYDSLRKHLIGPLITNKGEYYEFKWYKLLEWGDTAAVHIDVYKKPSSFSWRDDFYWPRVTMNYQWYYFLFPQGISKFADILPEQYKKEGIDSSKYKPYHGQSEIADSIHFTVIPDRLFYFLQKGYFTIVEKNDTYTIVDFYEPIANIVHKHKKDTITTMSAKVFMNDSMEVFMIPYDIPIEIRNK